MTATTIPLVRPWWARLTDAWRPRRRAPAPRLSDRDYEVLRELSAATLRDIGAPDWVQPRDRGLALWTLERARW